MIRDLPVILTALALLWAAAWALSGCAGPWALAPQPVYDHALADGVRATMDR